LAAASTLAALLSQPLAAQEGRQFKDAWFWGLKGGATTFSSASPGTTVAPLVGADWVIARTRGGLYVSFDQSLLTTQGSFQDRDPANQPFEHFVDLSGMRRLSIAGLIFPRQTPTLHPYLGAGFAMHQIATATMEGGQGSTSRYAAAQDSVQAKRSTFTPVFMGGAQLRLPRFSVFAQGTASPSQQQFFLNAGRAFSFTLEGGVRYNVGSSIDRTR
jgi:hypothetical protein